MYINPIFNGVFFLFPILFQLVTAFIFVIVLARILKLFSKRRTTTYNQIKESLAKNREYATQVKRPLSGRQTVPSDHHPLLAGLDRLPNDDYKSLTKVMVEDNYGVSQIDGVVFSKYGIFVIVAFDEPGNVHGSEYADSWTVERRKEEKRLRNPIKVAFEQIDNLERITKAPNHYFLPVVVYGRGTNMELVTGTKVLRDNELANWIISNDREYIDSAELSNYYNLIKNARMR